MSRPGVNKSSKQDFIKVILKREVGEIKIEWESERVDILSQMELIAAQESSIWPSVCVES